MKTRTTGRRKFVLKCSLNNPDVDLEGFDCFVVTVDPAYARLLLERVALFEAAHAQDSAALELYFWDSSGGYFARNWDARKPVPRGRPSRTECEQLVVDDREVFWTAIPKHTDVYASTDSIPLATLREIAGISPAKGENRA